MKKIDEILASGVEEIKSGRSTVEQFLERHESYRGQLEPLLRIAAGIQQPPPVRPSRVFKNKARVHLMEYIHQEQTSRKSWKSVFTFFRMPLFRSGWIRVAAIVISAILVLAVAGTGTAYAAQDSLPGEMLYPVKTFTEDFRVWLETDKAAEAALELEFAEKRLNEMERLVDLAPENLDIALSCYERNLNKAFEKIGQIRTQNQYRQQLEQFSLMMANHITLLDTIEDNSGEYDTDTFKQTREITMNHYALALRSISQLDAVRATEMNIELMQNRLQRAYDANSRGQKGKAEEALKQYIDLNILGEEIFMIAEDSGQDTSEIVEMNSEAAQQNRYELGKINNDVSEEIKSKADSITDKMTQSHGAGSPVNNEYPADTPVDQDNQQPVNQSQDPGNTQQEPDSQQQQPDGQGQQPNNGQGGSGNGSGGK